MGHKYHRADPCRQTNHQKNKSVLTAGTQPSFFSDDGGSLFFNFSRTSCRASICGEKARLQLLAQIHTFYTSATHLVSRAAFSSALQFKFWVCTATISGCEQDVSPASSSPRRLYIYIKIGVDSPALSPRPQLIAPVSAPRCSPQLTAASRRRRGAGSCR